VKDRIQMEQMSQNESKQIENFKKDDELQLLQTLNSISGLSVRTIKNLNNLYKLIQSAKEPNVPTDSQIENEKRMLHVKSDHQLFLIKDLTEEVTKIMAQAKDTKEEFYKCTEIRRNPYNNKDLSEFELSSHSGLDSRKITHLMDDMD
jgi:hypothetical protein